MAESTDGAEEVPKLRVPQARVLAALMPEDPESYWTEWPVFNRAQLGVQAGYTAISGSITRALNGIHPGSSSGDPHLGLLALELVEEVNIDGETNYRATALGVRAYQLYIQSKGGLPEVRDPTLTTNTNRGYKFGRWKQGEDKYRGKKEVQDDGSSTA